MENTQPTKTGKGKGYRAGMSDGSTKPQASMPLGASVNLSSITTATILNALQKTWTSAALEELRSKIGLVAGALADFKQAGGLVAVKQIDVDGRSFVKILLVAEGLDIKKLATADGMDFEISLVAEKAKEA